MCVAVPRRGGGVGNELCVVAYCAVDELLGIRGMESAEEVTANARKGGEGGKRCGGKANEA